MRDEERGLSSGGAFMMSPICGVIRRVRREQLLSEGSGGQLASSGLAEFPSTAHATPRSRDRHAVFGDKRGTQELSKCRSSSVVATTSRVNTDHETPGRCRVCPHHPGNPRRGGVGGGSDVPSRSCAEVEEDVVSDDTIDVLVEPRAPWR